MKSDREITHALRDLNGNDLVGSGGFGVTEKRRPEQTQGPAGEGLEQALRRVDLQGDQWLGKLAEIGVGERVVSDVMTLIHDAPHQVRIRCRVFANDEETGMNALFLQDVEDLWRPVWIGTIIKSERDLARQVA